MPMWQTTTIVYETQSYHIKMDVIKISSKLLINCTIELRHQMFRGRPLEELV